MKKTTLSASLLFLCLSLLSQPEQTQLKNNSFNQQASYTSKGLTPYVAPFAIIWSDDFSNPATWTTYTPVGSGAAMDWVIGTAGPMGDHAIPAILSTTESNGFALFDSDFNCSYDQIADITSASSINCSAYPFVSLNFQQQYRRFRDSTFVFVSNDGFAWTKYPVNVNVEADFGYSVNPEHIKVDISATAGSQATVWIRFEYYSPNSLGFGSGCNYAWMVDDVFIAELPPNDVVIDQANIDFAYLDGGYYTQTPISQIVPVSFRTAISNQGALPQTSVQLNVKISDGAGVVYNQNSLVLPLLPYQAKDTLSIATGYTPPAAIKNYSVTFVVSQAETELAADSINNIVMRNFAITDTVYARDNGISTGTATPNIFSGGAFDDAKIGLKYEFPFAATATSISAYIDSSSGIGVFAEAKLYEHSGGIYTEIAASPLYTVNSAISQWVNFPLPFTTLIAGKTYLAAIVITGIATGPDLFLVLGADNITKQPEEVCEMFLPGFGSWAPYDVLPMIRLNVLNPFAGISEEMIDEVHVSQNIPNPANGVSVIRYELKGNTLVTLNVYDSMGKVVAVEYLGEQNAGVYSLKFDVSSLSAGIYYYSLQTNNCTTPALKMIVVD